MPEARPSAASAFPSEALDLASEWRRIGAEWAAWWARAALPPAAGAALAGPLPALHDRVRTLVPPAKLAEINAKHQAKLAQLWQAAVATPLGAPLPQVVDIPADDKRFRAEAWRTSPFHSMVLQSYLVNAAWLTELAANADLPGADRARLAFMTANLSSI